MTENKDDGRIPWPFPSAKTEVPLFDSTQPCALTVLKPGAPMPTMCPRCKNPHHKCDLTEEA